MKINKMFCALTTAFIVSTSSFSSVYADIQSDSLLLKDITITNNARANDIIYVMGLAPGDEVNVYSYSQVSNGKLLAKQKAGAGKTDLSISLSQLGPTSGYLYLSVTTPGMTESARVRVPFSGEPTSYEPYTTDVSIVNKSGVNDTITVNNLVSKDVVKVYSLDSRLLGSATATKDFVTLSVSQLGKTAGSVYVTVTSVGMNESDRTRVSYAGENQSLKIDRNSVTITNNVAVADIVSVEGLQQKDFVTVYGSDMSPLASATCPNGKNAININVAQLGTNSGMIYITRKSEGALESEPVDVGFTGEVVSANIPEANALATNNVVGTNDNVYVMGLTTGDIIKVYENETTTAVLAKGTVAANKTDLTINVAQFGKEAGNIWIDNTTKGKLPSKNRTRIEYMAETSTNMPNSEVITVTNNVGMADAVEVSGLAEGDKTTVYRDAIGGNVLGTTTVAKGSTMAKVSITQLGSGEGHVYVSITNGKSNESSRVKVSYYAEVKTARLNPSHIIVTNNVNSPDTVKATNLVPNTTIYIYNKAVAGTLLGTGGVDASGTAATVKINQIVTDTGTIFVSAKKLGEAESDRVEVGFSSEEITDVINPDKVVITNNASVADTIEVDGLTEGDLVKAYDAASDGKLLGQATVGAYNTSTTISVPQLGKTSGTVYLALTKPNSLESRKIAIYYSSESSSTAPAASSVSITNNATESDVVKVSRLSEGDKALVYDKATAGTLLGSSIVATGQVSASITIPQLGTGSGYVFVSVIQKSKLESARVDVNYDAEISTDILLAENIYISNNAGVPDVIQVMGLESSDIVNIYKNADKTSKLGTGTVASGSTSVTISVPQLSSGKGNVFATVTTAKKLESAVTQRDYEAEEQSGTIDSKNITVVNSAGIASSITVEGLSGNDTVKVYDSQVAGTQIGSGQVSNFGSEISMNLTTLKTEGGTIYVSLTNTAKLEGVRLPVIYSAKKATNPPFVKAVKVTNNAGIADAITVSGLNSGDLVQVYRAREGGELLGSATVQEGKIETLVVVSQLGEEGGNIYVSVTSAGKLASARTEVPFLAETKTESLQASDVMVTNNSGSYDTIAIAGLMPYDIIGVYKSETDTLPISSGMVAEGSSSLTLNVSQLGSNGGTIYVTLETLGKTESDKIAVAYQSESKTLVANDVTVINNSIVSDIVKVAGLTENDVIKIYSASTGGHMLASASVAVGTNSVSVSVSQLTQDAGSIYVSVTSYGKCESSRTKVDYAAEQTSNPIFAGYVAIANNAEGTSDRITVTNLQANDAIHVYSQSADGTLLGSATVASSGNTAVVTIKQLGVGSGSVYISLTNYGKSESTRTKVDYTAE